ncbi:MAG: hypothetical protein ABFD97_04505 [Syntrophobacter sp.]
MQKFALRKNWTGGILILAALIFTMSGCGSAPAAGEPDNFREIKWGTEYSSLTGFSQIATDGDLAFYEKKNDNLRFDEIKLEQVIYGFHKGRFYTSMIYFPASAFTRMQELMTRQLGEPTKPDNTPSKLVWDGPSVTVLLTSGNSSDLARLVYLYKPLQLEVELKK